MDKEITNTDSELKLLTKQITVSNEINRKQISLWRVFLRGIIGGLGSTVGLVIILTFAVWILNYLKLVPFIGDFVDKIDFLINAKNELK